MGEQYSGACCLVKRVGLLLCAITDREESHYNQLNESLIWTLSSRLCNTNHANFGNSNPEHCGDGNLHDITIRDRISMEYTMCCCPRNWVNGLTYSCSKTLDVKQIFLYVQFKEQRDVTCMGQADRTVEPLPRNSLAAARAAPGVVKSLPTTVSTGGYTLGV